MHVLRTLAAAIVLLAGLSAAQKPAPQAAADRAAEKWVQSTLSKMSVDEKVGQLLVSSFQSSFISTDSDDVRRAGQGRARVPRRRLPRVRRDGAGAAACCSIRPTGPSRSASRSRRRRSSTGCRRSSQLPLLNTADFEAGVGFRIPGATAFPRAMAFGAARRRASWRTRPDASPAKKRARSACTSTSRRSSTSTTTRATRSSTRGRSARIPQLVGRLASAYIRGLQAAGVIGDARSTFRVTATPTSIRTSACRSSSIRASGSTRSSCRRFRAGIAAGADAVMTGAHRDAGARSDARDADDAEPADRQRAAAQGAGVRRSDLHRLDGDGGRDGDVHARRSRRPRRQGRQRRRPAFAGRRGGVCGVARGGEVRARFRRRRSTRRSSASCARRRAPGCTEQEPSTSTRFRRSSARARTRRSPTTVSQRSITLIKDERNQVPLQARARRAGAVSVGARLSVGLAHCRAEPDVHSGAAEALAERDGDRAVGSHDRRGDRAGARDGAALRRGGCVGVRARGIGKRPHGSRAAAAARCCRTIARQTAGTKKPFVTTFFGNPYVAMFLPELPAMLLTYDFYDRAEASAVRAIAGEAPIGGTLPIALPGMFEVGFGLDASQVGARVRRPRTDRRCIDLTVSPRP